MTRPQRRDFVTLILGVIFLYGNLLRLCHARDLSSLKLSAFASTQPVEYVPSAAESEGSSSLWAAPGHGHHHKYGHPLHTKNQQLPGNAGYITVGKHGGTMFNSIQEAVNSVPDNNAQWVEISIQAGVYREKIVIPYTKPFVLLQGEGRLSTMISYSDTASKSGTANSATVTVWADNFIARGIGFQNAAPPAAPGQVNGQAVAVLLANDKAAFYGCGFYGGQDTLFDYSGRHYFKDCYFEGNIDIISGNGQSVFKSCELHEIATQNYIAGSITAQKRSSSAENTGFVFINCMITGTGQVFLGRAWGPFSRVIYLYTYMNDIIIPAGWQDWSNPSRERTVYYGQYKCSGPGSNAAQRVQWSHELSDSEAQQFLQLSWIDGQSWLQEEGCKNEDEGRQQVGHLQVANRLDEVMKRTIQNGNCQLQWSTCIGFKSIQTTTSIDMWRAIVFGLM